MTATEGILAFVDGAALVPDIERIAAAAGLRIVHSDGPPNRRVWAGAAAVLVDSASARRCVAAGLPRRVRVVLVCGDEPGKDDWEAAVASGAERIVTLPAHERDLLAVLADAAESSAGTGVRGPVIAVLAGRGGAGASIFATALAQSASKCLLVDADSWGGGLDLILGSETESGVRWPDLSLAGGRVSFSALRDALPSRHGVSVLSGARALSGETAPTDIEAAPLGAVIDAGSRGGIAVVCDVARRPTAATELALSTADLVAVVAPADIRSCAAAAATAHWARSTNPNTGVVVRGPAPGGLRPIDVARIVGVPVLAAMRPQRNIDAQLERGGLLVRPRSPLARAARAVMAVLSQNPQLAGVSGMTA